MNPLVLAGPEGTDIASMVGASSNLCKMRCVAVGGCRHDRTTGMRKPRNITNSSFKIDAHLTLPEDEVQLWRVDLEAIRTEESRWQQVLSFDESKRASRFHFPSDRQRFVAARALLRTMLAGYLSVAPVDLHFSYSKKDKPSLGGAHADSGVTFNVSHSGGIALYAFARRRDVGIDVEQIRRDFDVEPIARR